MGESGNSGVFQTWVWLFRVKDFKGREQGVSYKIVKWSLPMFVKRSSRFHFIIPPPQNEGFPDG